MWVVFLLCPHAIKLCLPRVYPWRHTRNKMYQPLPLLNRESPGTKLALPSISGTFKMSFLKIINYSPYCHSQRGQMPYKAWTINEPHLPKNRPRCYVKSPTAQDACDRSQILIYHVFGACHHVLDQWASDTLLYPWSGYGLTLEGSHTTLAAW